MNHSRFVLGSLLVLALGSYGQTKRSLEIRDQSQDLYYYPAAGTPSKGTVLFLPGDGGWRGLAVTFAKNIASWGYDVYGFDAKRYLESFTSGRTTLTEKEVTSDMRSIAGNVQRSSEDKVICVGWSEGAGLAVLATAPQENKNVFAGLVVFGLSDSNVLGWRLVDNLTYITKKEPNEPKFSALPYMSKISPLPFVMIQSSGDEYTSLAEAKRLFDAAREPKRFSLVEAKNHRFDGNQEEFFRVLREGLEWISRTHH
jgi:pimeloyl-ACP methyl ester carboxylesterase